MTKERGGRNRRTREKKQGSTHEIGKRGERMTNGSIGWRKSQDGRERKKKKEEGEKKREKGSK